MMIYIWKRLAKVSDNYHCGGGLVVIASTVEHVKELVKEFNDNYRTDYKYYDEDVIIIEDKDWIKVEVYPVDKNFAPQPKIYIFPDAGCC